MAIIPTVDDSASLRQMVAFKLKSNDHEVLGTADGQEGLNAAQCRNFDLVISDVNMPKLDGIALFLGLRNLPGYRATPLLMLATESGDDQKQQRRSADATGLLGKPFNPDKLHNVVRQVLN